MKRKIVVALFLVLTLTCSLFAFTGCGDNDNSGNNTNGEKQIPVYQGMTITNANTATMSLMSSSYHSSGVVMLSTNDSTGDDNNNQGGSYGGDHADRNDTIDEENPYPDNADNENIEEEIKSSLNVVGSPDTIYYAEPNQDIYINIHIDNPDSFEIMSFTLNGKKYSSYMFEEGSDMETIVLRYNVGNVAGIIEYTIDAIKYIDGTEIKDVIIDGNKTVMAGVKTQNQVSANISGVDIGTNSLAFNANIKDNNALIEFSKGVLKAVLYDGFSIVAEKDLVIGDNTINFVGLKTNTLYQYAVVGYYDNLSGDGFGMNVLYKDAFYTDSVVLFDNITVGQESINFSFLWHEDHQNKSISALRLYKGNSFVKNVTANATSINELLSNTTYKLVAEYPNGDNTESIYIEFTTDAKATPSFAIKNENITIESIDAEYDIADIDNILSYYKVELYKGDALVSENADKEIDFTGLSYYTDYIVKITYNYDLNDGNGSQTDTYSFTCKTLPYIDVTECSIANTSAVSEGETIFMSVKLDNPLSMTIESVVINGETYNVTGASTKNKIFVEIVYNGQFTGGDTYLKIDQVNAKIDNTALSVEPKTELSDNVFINGKLEVLKIDFVNEDFEPIDWAFPSETVYVLITLNNPTGYTIDSVNTSITNLTQIDNNRWYFPITLSTGCNTENLNNISYHNTYLAKTLTYSDIKASCYKVKSDEVRYISTPNDLKNMNIGYYYELKNNIDLAGLEWIGNSFEGAFDGKGYSVRNLSFVGSIDFEDLGLFSQGKGVFQNTNIENLTIILDVKTNNTDVSCGVFAKAYQLVIKNCHIGESSTISIKNSTNANVGGFIGKSSNSLLSQCSSDCAIFVDVISRGSIGGLIGDGYDDVFFNCINTGFITATSNNDLLYVGGIVGSDVNAKIENVLNCGNIEAISQNWVANGGGIIGWTVFSPIIKNCLNLGEIYSTHKKGQIVATVNSGSTPNIANCFYKDLLSSEKLNNKSFYIETLGWSEDIWNFSELDVENGKYPKLKH